MEKVKQSQMTRCHSDRTRHAENLSPGSSQNVPDHTAVNIGQPKVTPLVTIGQRLVVKAHQVENCCRKIMDGAAILM